MVWGEGLEVGIGERGFKVGMGERGLEAGMVERHILKGALMLAISDCKETQQSR